MIFRKEQVAESARIPGVLPLPDATRLVMSWKRGVCRLAVFSLILFASAGSRPAFAGCVHAKQDENGPSGASLAGYIQAALTQRQTGRARDGLQKLLDRPQLDPDILLEVGVALAQSELYAEASEAFSRCARDHPEVFEAHYDLALAQFAQRKLPEASAALEASPRGSRAEEIARLYLRGKIEDDLGKTAEAQRDLEAAFAGAPDEENYALDLGVFYVRRRDYRRAAQVFGRGAAASPQSPFLLLGLSLSQLLSGRQVESVEASKKALKLEPDFTPAQLLMVFALYLDGKLEEAETVAAQELALPQPSPYLYYLHAALLLKRQSRDYQRILQELDSAKRGIPSCSLCYLAESKAHEAAGDAQAAIADLETAVRVDPGFSDAWYRLTMLYQRVGRREDAARAREEFQQIKTSKQDQEVEMLRDVFLGTLGDSKGPAPHP